MHEGTVITVHRDGCVAEVDGREVRCHIRGRLFKDGDGRSPVRVGDTVRISLHSGAAVVEAVMPRDPGLVRTSDGVREDLAPNVAAAVFVLSAWQPDLNALQRRLRMLDRMLVAAEYAGLPAMVCANKTDLVDPGDAESHFGAYRRVGYPLFFTSAVSAVGVDALKVALPLGLTAFVGPSGAGKTSLIKLLTGRRDLVTRPISEKTGKGRHATSGVEAHWIDSERAVADLPGLRSFGLDDVPKEAIPRCFPEIAREIDECGVRWCPHAGGEDCAVTAAVERGEISRQRFDSYLRLLEG